jgi:hypothetical protein
MSSLVMTSTPVFVAVRPPGFRWAITRFRTDALPGFREHMFASGFLHPLPVGLVRGIGPVSQRRLDEDGIHTIG